MEAFESLTDQLERKGEREEGGKGGETEAENVCVEEMAEVFQEKSMVKSCLGR